MKKKIITAFLAFMTAATAVPSVTWASTVPQKNGVSISMQALPPWYDENSWEPDVLQDAKILNESSDENEKNEIIEKYFTSFDQKRTNLLKINLTSKELVAEIERREEERIQNLSAEEKAVIDDVKKLETLTDEKEIRAILDEYYAETGTKKEYKNFLYTNTGTDAMREKIKEYKDAAWERTSALDYDPLVIEVDFKQGVSSEKIEEIVEPFGLSVVYSKEDSTYQVTKTLLSLEKRLDLTTKRAFKLFLSMDEVETLDWYRNTMTWANDSVPGEKEIQDAGDLDDYAERIDINYDRINGMLREYFNSVEAKDRVKKLKKAVTSDWVLRKIADWEEATKEKNVLGQDNKIYVDCKEGVTYEEIKKVFQEQHISEANCNIISSNDSERLFLEVRPREDLTTKKTADLLSGLEQVVSAVKLQNPGPEPVEEPCSITKEAEAELGSKNPQAPVAKRLDNTSDEKELRAILDAYFKEGRYDANAVVRLKEQITSQAAKDKIKDYEDAKYERDHAKDYDPTRVFITFWNDVDPDRMSEIIKEFDMTPMILQYDALPGMMNKSDGEDESNKNYWEIDPYCVAYSGALLRLDQTTEKAIALLESSPDVVKVERQMKDAYPDLPWVRPDRPSDVSKPSTDPSMPSNVSEPSKTSEPSNVSEPSKTSEPSNVSEPSKTSEPTETSEPSKTSEPTESSEPSKTSEPSNVSEPSKMNEPTEASEPSKTNEPTEASEPSKTNEPSKEPSEPSKTSEPSKEPSEPSKTSEPSKEPSEPSKASEPSKELSEPSKVSEPSKEPSEPSKVSEPSKEPSEPSKASEPSKEPSEPSKASEPSKEPSEPSKASEPSKESSEPSKASEPSKESSELSKVSEPFKEPSEPSKVSEPSKEPSKVSEPSKEPSEPSKASEPSKESSKVSEPSKESSEPSKVSNQSQEQGQPSKVSEPSKEPSEPSKVSNQSQEQGQPSKVSEPSKEPSEPSKVNDQSQEQSQPSEASEPSKEPNQPSKPKQPNQVKKILAYKIKKAEAKISWQKVSGADGYEILLKKGNGAYKSAAIVKSKTSVTLKKLDTSANYKIIVRAYKDSADGKVYGKNSQTISLNMKKQLILTDLKVASQIKLVSGKTKQLKLTLPKNADKSYVDKITFKVKNTKICSVKNGKLKAKKAGKTTVSMTVTLKNGQKKTFKTKVQITK